MINMQTIQWLSSKRQFSKDGVEGQIGLYVENLDGSLGASNFTKATLNVYVFFKADAPLKANVQSFLVNGKERESESIIDIQNTAKPFLIYFNNFQVKRGIESYLLKYEVELKVDGYYSSFMISLNDYLLSPNSESTGIIVEALESYFVSIEGLGEKGENSKIVSYTKYYEMPLNIYAQDFLTKQEFQREGYILTKFIEKTDGIKEEDKKIFNLQDEEVFIITDNRIHQFAAEYEKKTYKITYDGNGGVCEGKSQITLEEGEAPPTFTRNLHIFAGWSFSPSPFSETNSIPEELTKDIILYAKWNKMPVTLNYDMNDKEIINSSLFNESTPSSSAIVQITDEIPQTKDTYVFSHWIDNNGDKRVPGEVLTLDYLDEEMPITKKFEGEIINIENAQASQNYPPNIKIFGKSEQKQYEGYQLFDISKLDIITDHDSGQGNIIEIGKDYFIINTTSEHKSNGYTNTEKTLKELCPNLIAGNTYYLYATTQSAQRTIYVGEDWKFGTSKTITETHLNSNVIVYGYRSEDDYGDCKVSNLLIVENSTNAQWEPYVGGESSPNMKYPQQIVSAGQKLYEGTNFFDAKTALAKQIELGLCEVNDDGSVTLYPGWNNSNRSFVVSLKAGIYYFKEDTNSFHQLTNGDAYWQNKVVLTEDTEVSCYANWSNKVGYSIITYPRITKEEGMLLEPFTNNQEILVDTNKIDTEILTGNLLNPDVMCTDGFFSFPYTIETGFKWLNTGIFVTKGQILYDGYYIDGVFRTDYTHYYNIGTIASSGSTLRQITDGTIVCEYDGLLFMRMDAPVGSIIDKPYLGFVKPTKYEPYLKQSFTVFMQNGFMGLKTSEENSSYANYIDSLGNSYISNEISVERIREYNFNELRFSNIVSFGENGYKEFAYYISDECLEKDRQSLCTHFVRSYSWRTEFEHFYVSKNVVRIYTNKFSTKEEFEIWAEQQSQNGTPFKIIAALANPKEIPRTEEEMAQYNALRINNPNTTIINSDNAYMKVEYLTKNGEFAKDNYITEQLTAQWDTPTYTVTYHCANNDDAETIVTKTFNYKCGKAEEVEGYALWSFIKDNNNFDFQTGDVLPNTDIDLYSVRITEVTITYKDGYDKNNDRKVTEVYYNNHPSIQHTCIGSSYHVQQVEGEDLYYFQCWTDDKSNYYYPKYKYTFDVSENETITLYAVYAQSELVRYNTLIQDKDNQIVLVGNNFIENSNNNNLCVLNTGDICATEFVENASDDKVACIEIGYNKEIGAITFGNFIQQELLETNSSYELNLGTINGDPNILYLGNGDGTYTDDEVVLTI